MRKSRWLVMIPVALASMSVAYAAGGYKVDKDALIAQDSDTGDWVGSGAIGSVRSLSTSGAAVKQIWCRVDSAVSGNLATCMVMDASGGDPVRCISTDPSVIQTLSAMNADSLVTIQAATRTPVGGAGSPVCIRVTIENGSPYYPKWAI